MLTAGTAAATTGSTAGAAPVAASGRAAGGTLGAATVRCSSTPFRAAPAQRRWFRIPAVARTRAGTLVAFAERRDRMTGDDGNFDVVTARSTDDGCTWSAPRVIGDDASNRVDNPVPMVDATTGHLLVFSVISARPGSGGTGRGLYLQTSTDDGRTFTPLLSRPVRPEGAYRGGLTGPGHGIQLAVTHPGRLIFAMGYRSAQGWYGAYGVYSDDHGATWHTGYEQQDRTGRVDFIEGTIAELPSGALFISYRDRRDRALAGTARQWAVSRDGGTSLSSPFRRSSLPVVSVQGSALALTGTHRGTLLFSAPADPTRHLRRDMSVFASRDGGSTWPRRYQVELESTPGSYSDLVQLDQGSVGVLYETGTRTWKERIAFETFAVAALTRPPTVASRLSVHRSARPTPPGTRARVRATVAVAGIGSPPGRVTARYAGAGGTGSRSIDLTYSNAGTRWITLPRLRPGRYRLTLTYSGTGRIRRSTVSAGTLTVAGG